MHVCMYVTDKIIYVFFVERQNRRFRKTHGMKQNKTTIYSLSKTPPTGHHFHIRRRRHDDPAIEKNKKDPLLFGARSQKHLEPKPP